MGAATGDYNNDGFEDLLITGYNSRALYRNNGNGTFTAVSIFRSPTGYGPPARRSSTTTATAGSTWSFSAT